MNESYLKAASSELDSKLDFCGEEWSNLPVKVRGALTLAGIIFTGYIFKIGDKVCDSENLVVHPIVKSMFDSYQPFKINALFGFSCDSEFFKNGYIMFANVESSEPAVTIYNGNGEIYSSYKLSTLKFDNFIKQLVTLLLSKPENEPHITLTENTLNFVSAIPDVELAESAAYKQWLSGLDTLTPKQLKKAVPPSTDFILNSPTLPKNINELKEAIHKLNSMIIEEGNEPTLLARIVQYAMVEVDRKAEAAKPPFNPEIMAFIKFCENNNLDTSMHPMFVIFNHPETAVARKFWKAGVDLESDSTTDWDEDIVIKTLESIDPKGFAEYSDTVFKAVRGGYAYQQSLVS